MQRNRSLARLRGRIVVIHDACIPLISVSSVDTAYTLEPNSKYLMYTTDQPHLGLDKGI